MQLEKWTHRAAVAVILACNVTAGYCVENLSQRESELRTEFRNTQSPETLLHLALVREQQGHHERAIETWALAKKLWASKQMPKRSSAPTRSWGEAANFFIQRLQRKLNLHSNFTLRHREPAQNQQHQQQNDHSRRQLAEAAMSFTDSPSVDQLDLAVQADLDGDAIDEMFYIGKSGPLGKRTKKTMGIAKWNGKAYRVVWRTAIAVPFMVHVTDEDGDGWKEIFCGYEPDTDNVATLYFNGQTALFL